MVKHTRTIRRQFADDSFSVFDHFVGLALKELSRKLEAVDYFRKKLYA